MPRRPATLLSFVTLSLAVVTLLLLVSVQPNNVGVAASNTGRWSNDATKPFSSANNRRARMKSSDSSQGTSSSGSSQSSGSSSSKGSYPKGGSKSKGGVASESSDWRKKG